MEGHDCTPEDPKADELLGSEDISFFGRHQEKTFPLIGKEPPLLPVTRPQGSRIPPLGLPGAQSEIYSPSRSVGNTQGRAQRPDSPRV